MEAEKVKLRVLVPLSILGAEFLLPALIWPEVYSPVLPLSMAQLLPPVLWWLFNDGWANLAIMLGVAFAALLLPAFRGSSRWAWWLLFLANAVSLTGTLLLFGFSGHVLIGTSGSAVAVAFGILILSHKRPAPMLTRIVAGCALFALMLYSFQPIHLAALGLALGYSLPFYRRLKP